jgi:hypothetical protein
MKLLHADFLNKSETSGRFMLEIVATDLIEGAVENKFKQLQVMSSEMTWYGMKLY